METIDGTTTILNISSKKIDSKCSNVITFMQKIGIECNISSQKTVTKNDIDNGCQIVITGLNPNLLENKVWKPLAQEFDLKCAHMNMTREYYGCIRNFIRKSDCPIE